MERSEFEKRITERAEQRFNDQFKALVQYIHGHPIGARLNVKLSVDEEVKLANFGGNAGLLNEQGLDNKRAELTNLAKLKEDLLKEYRQKEIDEILSKLANFTYLFNQN